MILVNGLVLIIAFLMLKWIFRVLFVSIILNNIKKTFNNLFNQLKESKDSKLKEYDQNLKSLMDDYSHLSEYATSIEDNNRQLRDFVDDVEYLAFNHLASEELRKIVNKIKGVKE